MSGHDDLKTFKNRVRWNFKFSIYGYGINVKQALIDALERELQSIAEYGKGDLLSIETHEVISIDEKDMDDEE